MTLDVTIITGMSGAGRSAAADVLEDLGFFVIDNLPPALVAKVAELGQRHRRPPAVRSRDRRAFGRVRRRPRSPPWPSCARWARAPACCSSTRPTTCSSVATRRAVASTRSRSTNACPRASPASACCSKTSRAAPTSCSTPPTSTCTSCATGCASCSTSTTAAGALQTSIVSFGYKHGLPIDVDLVFDCRFLPNPHWVDELRPLTGTDPRVRDYVLGQPETGAVPRRARAPVRALAPGLRARGQVVPVDRHRLHRRSPSQRGDRDRAGPPARAPRRDATGPPPRRRPWVTDPPSSRSVEATASPPRCAPCASTRVRSPRS